MDQGTTTTSTTPEPTFRAGETVLAGQEPPTLDPLAPTEGADEAGGGTEDTERNQ